MRRARHAHRGGARADLERTIGLKLDEDVMVEGLDSREWGVEHDIEPETNGRAVAPGAEALAGGAPAEPTTG